MLFSLPALALAIAFPLTLAQTAGTTAPLIYTYNSAQSASPSLLSAISAGGAPAQAVGTAAPSAATGLVPAMATTATVGPATVPSVTSNFKFSSAASGEVLSSNTRAPFLTTGTVNVSMATGTSGQTAAAKSAARSSYSVGSSAWVAGTTLVLSVIVGALMV